MTDYIIGRVVAVAPDVVEVSLLDAQQGESGAYGVPDNMTINLDTEAGPQPVVIGQPGTFVTVATSAGKVLGLVTNIRMKDDVPTARMLNEAERSGSYLIEGAARVLSVVPVGVIAPDGAFEGGVGVLPTVNGHVYAVPPSLLDKVFSSYAKGDFSLGTLSLLPQQQARINLDSFLCRHAAILGQTGGGKSWTVASILQKFARFNRATAILFDLHGEYRTAFGDDCDYIDASSLEFPYWLMNSEELIGLMVDRSEVAAPNQVAKFKELLQAAKEQHSENTSLGITKITVDTPVYFDFEGILDELRRLDVERITVNNRERNGPLHGQFTRLLMRIDSRLNDRRYDLIFHPTKYNTSGSMEELFRRLLGEGRGAKKKVVVLDMSTIPHDVRNSVIALALRCLFDFAYWHKMVHGSAYPIAVFCDEAHLYMTERAGGGGDAARLAGERIAKEGRKYGISLTVISQRPREVSATILSQCGNFLCLRLSNPDDQHYVKNLLPDSIRGVTAMFGVLRRGEAVLVGDSVMMPTRIRIDPPVPAPDSDDVSFFRQWSEDSKEFDLTPVLQAWRAQEV